MAKEEALKELEKPLYDTEELQQDKEYVIKKFGLTEAGFDAIMKTLPRKHEEFKSDTRIKEGYMNLLNKTQKIRKLMKKK